MRTGSRILVVSDFDPNNVLEVTDPLLSRKILSLNKFILDNPQEVNGYWIQGGRTIVVGREEQLFLPVAKLEAGKTIIQAAFARHGNDPQAKALPTYTVPCWGFCGAGEKFITTCDLTPLDATIADYCEANYLSGNERWQIKPPGSSYTITRTDVDGVFLQRNDADPRRVRQVIRVESESAKVMVIKSEALATLNAQQRAIISPLVDSSNVSIEEYNDLYNKGVFVSDRYLKIFQQAKSFEEAYSTITYTDVGNLFKYFAQGELTPYMITITVE